MTQPHNITPKALKRLRDLHASLSVPGQRAKAMVEIDKWLVKYGKTWNDIAELIYDESAASARKAAAPDPRDAAPPPPASDVTVLDLIRNRFETYCVFETVHEVVVCVLWAIHTHVYELFEVTPRLVLTSATTGCGKSRVFDVLERLVARPKRADNWTVATLYDSANDRRTLFADEGDNLPFAVKGELRAIYNSGYAKGGIFPRGVGKHRREYATSAPLALASIGVLTPPGTLAPPLLRRGIVVLLRKRKPKHRLIKGKTSDLDRVYQHILQFVRTAKFDLDPELPAEVDRGDPTLADNWRVLISVADACSPGWGKLAREAAIWFERSGRHEDPVVMLLRDARTIYDTLGTDRLFVNVVEKEGRPLSAAMHRLSLLPALHAMEHGYWMEFCGVGRIRSPLMLSDTVLRSMLRPLIGSPHSIWLMGPRQPGDSSAKGWLRGDWESVWGAYLGESGTSAQDDVPPLQIA